jgi:hypothetical protein
MMLFKLKQRQHVVVVQEPKMPEIKLTFTVEEVNTILIALNKAPIPAEVSVPLSEKIKNEAIPQVQPAPVEAAEATEAVEAPAAE